MMYKSTGVILKNKDGKEADRFYSVLTKERGLVTFKAPGAQKIKSRLAGHLLVFNEVKLHLATGSAQDIITGVEPIKIRSGILEDIKTITAANSVAGLVLKIVKEQPDNEIYRAVNDCLDAIHNDPPQSLLYSTSFGWYLLSASGFGPSLYNCVGCGEVLNASSKIFFDTKDGGALCGKERHLGLVVSTNQIKILRILTSNLPSQIAKFNLKGHEAFLSRLLNSYIVDQLGELPYSLNFVKYITNA